MLLVSLGTTDSAPLRRIAQVRVGDKPAKKKRNDQKQPRVPTGKNSDGKTLKIHTSTCPGKDYRNLTPSQLTQVCELREKEKSKKERKTSAVQKADDVASAESNTFAALQPTKKTKSKVDKNGRRVKSLN